MTMETKMQPNRPFTPLQKYIQEFLEFCEIGKNQSRRTVENYHHYLGRFDIFSELEGVNRPQLITIEHVRRYRLYLNRLSNKADRQLKLVTQNYHLIALRAFLKYLTKMDIATLAPEKIELPKNPQRQVEFLED